MDKVTYSETIKIFSKPWIWAAAVLGIIEGLAWTILPIISACFYHGAINITEDTSTYGALIFFLYHSDLNPIDQTVSAQTFNAFMFLYIILSFIWLTLSLYLAWAMIRNKWKKLINAVAGWAILTFLLSVIDVILTGMIAADFKSFQDNGFNIPTLPTTTLPPENAEEPFEDIDSLSRSIKLSITSSIISMADPTVVQTAYGIVMSLVARGYVLWLANVIVAIIMSIIALRMKREERPSLLPFIDAYATESRPPFDMSDGRVNESFQDEESMEIPAWSPYKKGNNPLANGNGYSGHKSTTPSTIPIDGDSYQSNFSFSRPVDTYEQPRYDKVAKIGKTGRKSPLQNVPPPNVPFQQRPRNYPYIPDPDYTPPGSPTLQQPKSVLRPRSNYVL